MTSGVSHNAAILRAAIDGSAENLPGSLSQMNRRSLPVKHSGSTRVGQSAATDDNQGRGNKDVFMDTAADDNNADDSGAKAHQLRAADTLLPSGQGGVSSKPRVRRASEGSHLSKGEGKRASGELRCEKCGKGYKHSSCLTKHLWEHTPEWSYTSKLLISKHQQVQLLEAASVLVGMNQDGSETQEATKLHDSDHSSASPAASGTSEMQDDYLSSAETTPPPTGDNFYAPDSYSAYREKRHSGNSSSFSRSYQSASSMPVGSMLSVGIGSGNHRNSFSQRRPSTSGVAAPRNFAGDEDEAGLAAAVESLCSFGTPRSGAVHHLPLDAPPVPPLPAQYASQNLNRLSGSISTPTAQPPLTMLPSSMQRVSNERGPPTKGRDQAIAVADDYPEERATSHGRIDDDDELMFGRDEAIN